MNGLNQEISPYLLQHAENPVNWQPWGQESLAPARAEEKPIFLSVGYSACHWCHVMAHESFENPAIAELLNRDFVCIKVDREERPDLDQIYMEAVQAMTGQGGWPMSVFLTPEQKPFFGGTYWPPQGRHCLWRNPPKSQDTKTTQNQQEQSELAKPEEIEQKVRLTKQAKKRIHFFLEFLRSVFWCAYEN